MATALSATAATPGSAPAGATTGAVPSRGSARRNVGFDVPIPHLFRDISNRDEGDWVPHVLCVQTCSNRNDGDGSVCRDSYKNDADWFCFDLEFHVEAGTEVETGAE